MSELDPGKETLRIERVVNGWIIQPVSLRDPCWAGAAHVATSPEQLAGILMAWAQKQAAQ